MTGLDEIQIHQSGATVYVTWRDHPGWVAVVSPNGMSREAATVKIGECVAWRPIGEVAETIAELIDAKVEKIRDEAQTSSSAFVLGSVAAVGAEIARDYAAREA